MRKSRIHNPSIPEIGEGKRGEAGHIGYLLRQAHAAHRIRMERALQDIGLTLPQFSVLTMLAEYPKASGAELARLSLLTPQTMSVIVGNLERAGMVLRRPHKEHGRIQIIEITDAGRELLVRCKSAVQPTETILLAGVSNADEIVVRRWLVQVAKQLGTM
ncbi:putative HTH-type transcriptional regulator [Xenorhabdus ishibashii]|uniref:Putative HTH-type transcriptional regulator n=2 Tax=Xenorhabdus ishibashii TaxID=1034471 RepID=A0A2D0KE55_9GAMM|nr:putative HTH-type transcriptional regulator [Xenorhabdus ishibashii]